MSEAYEEGQVVGEPAKTKTGEQEPQLVSPTDPPAYSSNIPGPMDPEKAWTLKANDAIRALYPYMRDGVDYKWGRPADDPTGEPRMLHWDDSRYAPADEGRIREEAEKLAKADPYVNYAPQRPLHGGEVPPPGERSGDQPTLPSNVAQSEVNPKTDQKHPSQPYQEGETPIDQEASISEDADNA